MVDGLMIGNAGEHMMCADLLKKGYNAFLTVQRCQYDVVMDYKGRPVRIQVRASEKPRPLPQRRAVHSGYLFSVRRCGKGGRQMYSRGDFDLLALVAVDRGLIAYVPFQSVHQTMHFRDPSCNHHDRQNQMKRFERFTIEKALAGLT